MKGFAIFISDTEGDAMFKGVCGAVMQNFLWGRMIAYFFIRQAFHFKFSQNIPFFPIQKVFGFVDQITMNEVNGWAV